MALESEYEQRVLEVPEVFLVEWHPHSWPDKMLLLMFSFLSIDRAAVF